MSLGRRDREAWTERLLAWCDSSEQKAEAYRAVRTAALVRAESFKAQAVAFGRYARREEHLAQRIEGLAIGLLRATEDVTGAAEIECSDDTKLKLRRRKSQKVDITDEAAVPEGFIRVKKSVDKSAAGKVLKAGEEIPGLALLESVSEWVAWGL
jgi:hypothetical protein